MHTPVENIVRFVLDQIETASLDRRAGIYRDIAEIARSPAEKRRLLKLAEDCEAILNDHQQLVLDFKRRAL